MVGLQLRLSSRVGTAMQALCLSRAHELSLHVTRCLHTYPVSLPVSTVASSVDCKTMLHLSGNFLGYLSREDRAVKRDSWAKLTSSSLCSVIAHLDYCFVLGLHS